ncbi:MAG: 30S ribosomal protein S5 [Candidatus Komeilibacteria bacterium RIFCSPLOWO2_01_FULL_52_15]|uniref:Small ribosomal subunit protein uS5 n=2 Tax=Candidatus Komeiliibacteriota TaxID=1817908 RepID=A0A1G2BRP0_9BACT|nr:MAG: 30S ribosomal protein S5 [Candidatus Komeilibacteria bacterium RIFCSPHIGHO2_01_FULL_52_14]OGY91030.1 MAG: 30S ribosomal protein S5 [Candidatus Komeilibacteria bacterium RIFCSPLOWO2_01_FULL_52_15]
MRPRQDDEFDQQMIDLSRVTRVMAGGKRMRFRACIVIGDRKGRVGWGLAKGADVSLAIQKATAQAKKNIITVSMVKETIPHEVRAKFKAARLLLKPATAGKGLIAGGVVRTVLDLAGYKNIVSKMFGSPNKINNVAAVFKALGMLRRIDAPAKMTPEEALAAEEKRKKQQV